MGSGETLRRRRTTPSRASTAGALFVLALALIALPANAAVVSEDFASDPGPRGWRVFGDASLFQWNATSQHLEVTWDSSRPNSYFYRPLGDILTRRDDFALEFDLRLHSIFGGANPAKPSTFQIAIGFVQQAAATNAAFIRATVPGTRNLVEFDYFPAADMIDATVSPVLVSSNHQFIPGFNFPLELTPGALFHVALRYSASNQTLVTTMTREGVPFGPVQDVRLPGSFTDFRVDAVAVCSYSDTGDAEGSVYARGTVDNILVTTPPAPVRTLTGVITNGQCRLRFLGRTHWTYTLLRSEDMSGWTIAGQLPGVTLPQLELNDPLPPAAGPRFYRVLAERP